MTDIDSYCDPAAPARLPHAEAAAVAAAAAQDVSPPRHQTHPPAARTPPAAPVLSACSCRTSCRRPPRPRSWWDLGCPCLPACRRVASGSAEVCLGNPPTVTARRRNPSRRCTGAGVAGTAAAAPASGCPSQKKAWWARIWTDWEALLPWTVVTEVSKNRLRALRKVGRQRARNSRRLSLHADRRGLVLLQLWHHLLLLCVYSCRAKRRQRRERKRERSILFGYLQLLRSWVSQDAVLSQSVTSRSKGGTLTPPLSPSLSREVK